jgi:hypothetical protein
MRSCVRGLGLAASLFTLSLLGGGVAAATSLKHLPHGVPIPSYSKLLHVETNSHEDAYVVSVKDEKSAYAYWIKALPQAGFKVNTKESSSKNGQGQIWFSGHDCLPAGTLINIYKGKAVVNLEVS